MVAGTNFTSVILSMVATIYCSEPLGTVKSTDYKLGAFQGVIYSGFRVA